MDFFNDLWTAWNQQLGATVATVLSLVAILITLWKKVERLTSAVRRWRLWATILYHCRKIKRNHRLRKSKRVLIAELKRKGMAIPTRTYAGCLVESPRTAIRDKLQAITPEKPPWMNDYFVATALESLASQGKIVKAARYEQAGFPPAPFDYVFQLSKTSKSARDEANDIETNSACAVYRSFHQCLKEPRYERQGYAETTDARTTIFGTQTRLKEGALPCERCWEEEGRKRDIRLLVENITKYDLADTATREVTGDNGEFQEAVIAVCTESKCLAETASVKEIVKRAIEIRRKQTRLVAPDSQPEWTKQTTEDFSACLTTYIKKASN